MDHIARLLSADAARRLPVRPRNAEVAGAEEAGGSARGVAAGSACGPSDSGDDGLGATSPLRPITSVFLILVGLGGRGALGVGFWATNVRFQVAEAAGGLAWASLDGQLLKCLGSPRDGVALRSVSMMDSPPHRMYHVLSVWQTHDVSR